MYHNFDFYITSFCNFEFDSGLHVTHNGKSELHDRFLTISISSLQHSQKERWRPDKFLWSI